MVHIAAAFEDLRREAESESSTEAPSLADEKVKSEGAQEVEIVDDCDEEDDESIEQYMSRLMKRVKGGSSPIELPTVNESEEAADIRASTVKLFEEQKKGEKQSHGSQAEAAEAEKVDSSSLFKPGDPILPRSQAPERMSTVQALREIANESAKHAFDVSLGKVRASQAVGKCIVAGVALISGILCLLLQGRSDAIGTYSAMVSFVLASFWGMHGAVLFMQMRRAQANTGSSKRKGDDEGIDCHPGGFSLIS